MRSTWIAAVAAAACLWPASPAARPPDRAPGPPAAPGGPTALPAPAIGAPALPAPDLAGALFHGRDPVARAERPLLPGDLSVTIDAGAAITTTTVTLEVENPGDGPIEAHLRLEVPPGAAVHHASLVVGETTMVSGAVERDRGRIAYDTIVGWRRDPLLVEWAGARWIDVSVFPVPPGERRRFELTWSEPTPLLGGRVALRVPVLGHRGQLIARPATVTVNGIARPVHGPWLLGDAPDPTRPASGPRLEVLRAPARQASPAVVVVVETGGDRSDASRADARATLAELLALLPPEARVTILAADWLVTDVARATSPAEALGALARLDERRPAGVLDAGYALDAATRAARQLDAAAVIWLGPATGVTDALAGRLRARLAEAHLALFVAASPASWSFARLVRDSGGAALDDPGAWLAGDAGAPAAFVSAVLATPRLAAAPAGAAGGRPLPTSTGETVWLAARGPLTALPEAERALLARSLVDVRFDAERDLAGVGVRLVTPATSLMSLESDADHARWGIDGGSGATAAPAAEPAAPAAAPAAPAAGAPARPPIVLSDDPAPPASSGPLTASRASGGAARPGRAASGDAIRPRSAAAPAVRVGASIVMGSLDKDLIRRVVRRGVPRVRACWERELRTAALAPILLVARFTIVEGRVTVAEVRASDGPRPRLEACVAEVFRGLEFPRARGEGRIHVTYPLRLVPSDETWDELVLELARAGNVPGATRFLAGRLGLPATSRPEELAWALAARLREQGGDAAGLPAGGAVLASRLLRAADRLDEARRMLSEAAPTASARIALEYRLHGEDDLAARAERLWPGDEPEAR